MKRRIFILIKGGIKYDLRINFRNIGGGGIKLKSQTFSGQTAPTGSLQLQDPWDGKKFPIFATYDGGYRYSFFYSGWNSSLYMQFYTVDNTQVLPASGVTVSGTYYYLEIE